MAKASGAEGWKGKGAKAPEGSVSVRAIEAIWTMRGSVSDEPYEARLAALLAILGDGSALLKKESVDAFAEAFGPGSESELALTAAAMERPKGRLALENYLSALEGEDDGEAMELGLLGMLRCGALDKAPGRVADEAFIQVRDAIYSDIPHPERLASEWLRHPVYLERMEKIQKRTDESVVELFESMRHNAIYERRDSLREGARRVMAELLDAAEEIPKLLEPAKGQKKGALLAALANCDGARLDKESESVNAWLNERAREWIKSGRDWPEAGELAAALCETLEGASHRSELAAREATGTLKTALDCGMGARRGQDPQPLSLLADAEPGGKWERYLGEAARLLLDAGASEIDLLGGLEERMRSAPNQSVVHRVRALLEARQLKESLDGLSDEEAELVREFRRVKRGSEADPEAGRSRPRL